MTGAPLGELRNASSQVCGLWPLERSSWRSCHHEPAVRLHPRDVIPEPNRASDKNGYQPQQYRAGRLGLLLSSSGMRGVLTRRHCHQARKTNSHNFFIHVSSGIGLRRSKERGVLRRLSAKFHEIGIARPPKQSPIAPQISYALQ